MNKLSRRDFLRATALGMAALAVPAGARAQCDGRKPNVICIISDDQGWGDIGYNNPKVYSPNLDRLAKNGALFAHNYVMPQCTPTRVAVMTGQYPSRFGPHAQQATNEPAFPKGTPTLASMFQQCGYETFLCGKWHMGSTPDHGPNHFGFDESYGCLAGAVGMYDHRYREGEFEQAWHRNHEPIPGNEEGVHATDLTVDAAITFIERGREAPFFLYLAFNAVHTPLDERGQFVDQPTALDPVNPERWRNEDKIEWFNDPEGKIQSEPDPQKRLLLAAVHHMDDAIGQVVEALERAGQRDNTLILFASDNGPQVNWPGNAYPHDLHLAGFNQPIPMRGSKTDVWEGGIHVPAFANWPGEIPPQEIAAPVHVVDWFPTLAGILGYKPEEPIPWDGIDLSPALFEDLSEEERGFYWVWGEGRRWALRYEHWKIAKYGEGEPKSPSDWELYNLETDPKEQHDVAGQHPEIVEALHERFLIQRGKDMKVKDW